MYSENGNLIFEGEYLYDQIIKGKEYINGRLEYINIMEKDMMKKVI